ncbi:MAG: undecaprenyl/decaprenyl-phosphate alpha-N-acetylglucosaminyl 1-phosphate transferase [Sphingobacteriales bacterium]|nr:MAG: undecaprenyl/decaprenyl-phosphate alpha-N-acetylglucosaminyl 1-phosphate transferase [Sphingobacteriales bacterium]
MIETYLAAGWAFFTALIAVPSIIYIAHLKNILDAPNQRTVHESLIPRLGGLAVFAAFMSAMMLFGDMAQGVQYVLAVCIILFFYGLKDDLVSITAMKKFFVQILVSGMVMYLADIRITSFQGMLGIYELQSGFSYLFTFLVIVGVTNSINLIDGLDGLAGSIIVIVSATFGIYFSIYGDGGFSNYATIAFCLMGGTLGFLRYNFHKATIFLGDTGTMVCGFIISVLAIQFIEMRPSVEATPAIALGVLFVPLFDTIRVIILRLIKGVSPFDPDKNHIHHRIMAMGCSQLSTVFILALINILAIAFVISFSEWGNLYLFLSLLSFSLILSFALGIYRQRSVQTVASFN